MSYFICSHHDDDLKTKTFGHSSFYYPPIFPCFISGNFFFKLKRLNYALQNRNKIIKVSSPMSCTCQHISLCSVYLIHSIMLLVTNKYTTTTTLLFLLLQCFNNHDQHCRCYWWIKRKCVSWWLVFRKYFQLAILLKKQQGVLDFVLELCMLCLCHCMCHGIGLVICNSFITYSLNS